MSESTATSTGALPPLPPKWSEATAAEIGEAAHAGYCGDDGPRPDWAALDGSERGRWARAGIRAAARAYRSVIAEHAHLTAANKALTIALEQAGGVSEPSPPAEYAVVEAMGHRTLIGRLTEVTIAGAGMLRVDRIDGKGSHTFPPSAVYMLTPCDEAQARAAAARQYGYGVPVAICAALGGTDDDDDDDAIGRDEAGEDWNAPDRDLGGDEDGDDASDVDPF